MRGWVVVGLLVNIIENIYFQVNVEKINLIEKIEDKLLPRMAGDFLANLRTV